MNKRIKKKLAKRLNIRKYSDYKICKDYIRECIKSRIALFEAFSAKHLIHDSNSAEVDQMMMHVNAIKNEFGLDNCETK